MFPGPISDYERHLGSSQRRRRDRRLSGVAARKGLGPDRQCRGGSKLPWILGSLRPLLWARPPRPRGAGAGPGGREAAGFAQRRVFTVTEPTLSPAARNRIGGEDEDARLREPGFQSD